MLVFPQGASDIARRLQIQEMTAQIANTLDEACWRVVADLSC